MNPHLLEIAAWPWLERLSRAEGRVVTLGDVPCDEWDRLADRKFAFLFLMGVWRRSAIGREIARTLPSLRAEYDRALPGWTEADVTGSPYCIQAYEPDDRMGGWAGLDAARHELKARGIGLVLDFVPNHTAFDHPWIAAHPARYVIGTDDDQRAAPASFRTMETVDGPVHVACGRDPYFEPWSDVAQLNYFNPETRAAMRGVLRDLAARCDGVRCDMAMLVLNDVFERTWRHLLRDIWRRPFDEFWPGAIRSSPGLTCIAEVYWELERVLLDQGFNFAYDKRLLDCLHAPDAGPRTRNLLAADWPEGARLARFIENHDEPRSVVALGPRLTASASLAGTLPGMRFFFDGQMDGRRIRTPVQLGRWRDESSDPAVRAFYERLLAFASNDLLHDGEWGLLDSSPAGDRSSPNIVAHRWRSRSALAIVVANLGDREAQAHLPVAADLTPGVAFDFEDCLTGAKYRWTREALERTGLYVRLNAGAAHLFLVHAVDAS